MANTISGVTKLNGVPTQARITLIDVLANTIVGSKLSEGADGVTKSLLHFEGASGSQTFTDECGKTWTHTGASVQLASTAKFGATSLYVGNTASWIQTVATADHDFGSGDFTVEAFLYLNAAPPATGLYRVAISRDDTAVSGNRGWLLLLDGDNAGKLAFACSVGTTSYAVMSSAAPTTGVWIHVAVARSGGTLRMYLDGVQQSSVAIAGVLNNPTIDTRVGDGKAGASNLGSWNGYIDELRITKGLARYTANFTPPTAPFTLGAASGAFSFTGLAAGRYELLTLIPGYKALVDGPWVLDGVGDDPYWVNVSSLLHFNGANGSTTFTDEKGLVWTPASNAKIDTALSKFGGASGLLDGVADNITTPATAAMGFGSGDYTVEGWLYQANEAADRCIFDNRNASTEGIAIYSSAAGVDNVRRLLLASNTAIIAGTGSTQFPVNTWSHWAVCRSGGTVRGFIDGVQMWSVTDSRTLASSAPAIIGANYTTGQEFVGRLDEMRITKGVARYTANFTPPTAAFPNS